MSVIIDEKSKVIEENFGVEVGVEEVNNVDMKEIFRKAAVLCVLQKIFFEDKSEQVRENVTLHDNISEKTGADSLESVEAIMKIEEDFGITIPDNEAVELVTLDKVLTYIENKTKDFIDTPEKKERFYLMLDENVSSNKEYKEKLFENAKLLVITDEDKQAIERLKNTNGDFNSIAELIDESVA